MTKRDAAERLDKIADYMTAQAAEGWSPSWSFGATRS